MTFKRKKPIIIGLDYWLYTAIKETAKNNKLSMAKFIRLELKKYYKQ